MYLGKRTVLARTRKYRREARRGGNYCIVLTAGSKVRNAVRKAREIL